MAELVQSHRVNRVAVVTLNVPERRNAISLEVREEAIRTLTSCIADRDCRALVLTGAGGTFSSGTDVKSMTSATTGVDPMGSWVRLGRLHDLVRMIAAGPKPVVAAVEGHAYGAGMSLALACDFVVAAADAKFCAAFGRLGIMPDAGLMWSLPQRVGLGRAKELMMTGRVITGDEALSLGIVDEIEPPGGTLDAAIAQADRLAAAAPLATGTVKSLFARGPMSLDAVLEAERNQQPMLILTEDHAEGRAAMAGKRPPVFQAK